MCTGSEVEIAMNAQKELQDAGIGTRVVSVPCFELFDQQDSAYQQSILCNDSIKVGIEAAVRYGWDKYIGSHSTFIGMSGFGDSAPADELYEKFGITAEAVVKAVKDKLSKK